MFFILTFIYLIKTLQKYWHSWSAHCYVLVLCLYVKGEKEIIKILLSNLRSSCFKKWIIKTQGIKGGFVSRAGREVFFKPKNLQQGLAMSLLASVSWSKWTLRCLFSQRTCTVKKKKIKNPRLLLIYLKYGKQTQHILYLFYTIHVPFSLLQHY